MRAFLHELDFLLRAKSITSTNYTRVAFHAEEVHRLLECTIGNARKWAGQRDLEVALRVWIPLGLWLLTMVEDNKVKLVKSNGGIYAQGVQNSMQIIAQAYDALMGVGEWPEMIQHEQAAESMAKPLTARQQKRYPDVV